MSHDSVRLYLPGNPNIVAIGGGHGQSALLRGIKLLTRNVTAVCTVADDGGGSGVLRRELGILPPGDLRNCILALSSVEPLMEQLLDYRFTDGSLKGQSFGNLFLAAMNGISERFDQAVSRMCQVLNVTGQVLPVTCDNVQLEAELESGEYVLGESQIYNAIVHSRSRIHQVRLLPEHPAALPQVLDAIARAELIAIGPGSLYTSIIPNLLVDGVVDALRASHARKVMVMNIMTEEGETEEYTGADHLRELLRYAPGCVDCVLANNAPIPAHYLPAYAQEHAAPLELHRDEIEAMGIPVLERPLLAADSPTVRHDPQALAWELMQLLSEQEVRR